VKRLVISVCLSLAVIVGVSSSLALADQHANKTASHPAVKTPPKPKVAPADEYFGRLKMSILGIANTLKDQSLKVEREPEKAPSMLGAVNFTVDAIRDWQKKYPRDPWIARSLLALERFYEKINSDEARTKAKQTMTWLVRDFPNTAQGRVGKQELAEGKVGQPPPPAAAAVPATIDITKPILGDSSPAPAAAQQTR
jgi:hypothetical protein